jgi:hypothetical protein
MADLDGSWLIEAPSDANRVLETPVVSNIDDTVDAAREIRLA